MVVTIGWLVGIGSVWTLSGLFVLNSLMITTGYLLENQQEKPVRWYLLGTGCFAAIWVVLGLECRSYMEERGLVVGVPFLVTFWLFCTFGINAWLAIQKFGWYKNYYWVEISYILLSIFSKSALVWTVWYVVQTT